MSRFHTEGAPKGGRHGNRLAKLGVATGVGVSVALAAILSEGTPVVHAATGASHVHAAGALLSPNIAPVPRTSGLRATAAASLPTSVDLTVSHVPVGDQGQIGSCVEWAIDYA